MMGAALTTALVALVVPAAAMAQVLDCHFDTMCETSAQACQHDAAGLLSFALVLDPASGSARYEGDAAHAPMAVTTDRHGSTTLVDTGQSLFTTISASGLTVHSANLLLMGRMNRAVQWSGTCLPREE